MCSLANALSIATRAMLAEEAATQVCTNNLANLNTPGYSRERPIMEATDPVVSGTGVYGNGVDFEGFQSLRDRILELRIDEEQQNQGKYETYLNGMNQVQALFSDPAGGIGAAFTAFFNSLSQATTQADNLSFRENILSSARNLASAFHATRATLSDLQSDLDRQVEEQIQQVNQLTTQIASLNRQIDGISKFGHDAGTLLDQREQAIQSLSRILDISETQTESGLAISTANGLPLVVDSQSFSLGTSINSKTSQHRVFCGSSDITGQIRTGSLGGALAVRDTDLPDLLASLDQLAAAFSTAVNSVHQTGTTLQGNPGGLLFTAPPPGTSSAAAAISVAVTDPSQLALASSSSAGDNGTAVQLLSLRNAPIVGSNTVLGAYSQLVFHVGSSIGDAQSAIDTSSSILEQLQSQRDSVSGVSLDEETANLMQFQRGFEAAAHAISVIDSLMQTAISMGVTQ